MLTLKQQETILGSIKLKRTEIRQAFEKIINKIEYDTIFEQEESSSALANLLIYKLVKILEYR